MTRPPSLPSPGFAEYQGRSRPAESAWCDFFCESLTVSAQGQGWRIELVAVPFPGADTLDKLPGRAWIPEGEEMSFHADTFAEGGVRFGSRDLQPVEAEVRCLGWKAATGRLAIEIRLTCDSEEGGSEEVTAFLSCEVRTG